MLGSLRASKQRRFSPRVTLAVIGLIIKLLDPVKKKVVILQKSVRHTPAQKLTDAFVAILAGARGLDEINTRVRSDEGLQRAFGRESCADQSVAQETLNACAGRSNASTTQGPLPALTPSSTTFAAAESK